MAVSRAPKKGAKAGKSKSKPAAKKSSAKKVVAKKGKAAKKPVKIPAKAVLDAKDVALILKVKEMVIQQKSVLAELEGRGVTNIHRIVKKADQDLVFIARELEEIVPKQVEKLRKLGLSPYRMLKKSELELVAPPAPKAIHLGRVQLNLKISAFRLPMHQLKMFGHASNELVAQMVGMDLIGSGI